MKVQRLIDKFEERKTIIGNFKVMQLVGRC